MRKEIITCDNCGKVIEKDSQKGHVCIDVYQGGNRVAGFWKLDFCSQTCLKERMVPLFEQPEIKRLTE